MAPAPLKPLPAGYMAPVLVTPLSLVPREADSAARRSHGHADSIPNVSGVLLGKRLEKFQWPERVWPIQQI